MPPFSLFVMFLNHWSNTSHEGKVLKGASRSIFFKTWNTMEGLMVEAGNQYDPSYVHILNMIFYIVARTFNNLLLFLTYTCIEIAPWTLALF